MNSTKVDRIFKHWWTPFLFPDQQQYATPLDQSSAPSTPTDIVQNSMNTANYAPIPSTDMASFQATQDSTPIADQPSPDAQVVAQAPAQELSPLESS